MFNKSMFEVGKPLSKTIKKKIETKTKNSAQIKNAVNNCIQSNNNQNFNNCTTSIEYTPKDGDVHYAIQKAELSISGINNGNNWDINLKISDRYNFDSRRGLNAFSNAANDLGYVMQKLWMVQPYEWDVQYSFMYKE